VRAVTADAECHPETLGGEQRTGDQRDHDRRVGFPALHRATTVEPLSPGLLRLTDLLVTPGQVRQRSHGRADQNRQPAGQSPARCEVEHIVHRDLVDRRPGGHDHGEHPQHECAAHQHSTHGEPQRTPLRQHLKVRRVVQHPIRGGEGRAKADQDKDRE